MSHAERHKLPAKLEKEKKLASRKPRSDQGQPKKAVATILSGYSVSNEENKRIMRSWD